MQLCDGMISEVRQVFQCRISRQYYLDVLALLFYLTPDESDQYDNNQGIQKEHIEVVFQMTKLDDLSILL